MSDTISGDSRLLVLSAVPLRLEARQRYSGAIFMDLASLRRGGFLGALRILRSCKATTVIVTGEEAEIGVFRDVLVPMALAVPRAQCWYVPPNGASVRLNWLDIPLCVCRIFAGVSAGFAALAGNVIRLQRLRLSSPKGQETGWKAQKCLYLKPALSFGTLVGGSVGHVAGVANALRHRGIDVILAACTEQPLIDPGIKQVAIAPPSLMAYPHELNRFRFHRSYLRAVLRLVDEFRPDFIYQRYALDDMTGIFIRHSLGIPLILEFNGSETWIQRNWGEVLTFRSLAERIELANLVMADIVVVVSNEIQRQVCSLGVPQDRLVFYPNCVDSIVFDPARFNAAIVEETRRKLGIPIEADLFTFVGTFGRWHGTEILAMAIRHFVDHERDFLLRHRIHFLLVGDGLYGEKVRAMLSDTPFVSLPGICAQSETPAILAASDVCLSPHVPNPDGTTFFGSPTKLFEYMAMGRVIVASDLDQIGWVLRGWRPGDQPPTTSDRSAAAAILVEPGNVDSLVQGIRTAAQLSGTERDQLGRRARKHVLDSFTWDENIRTVLARAAQLIRPGGE